MWSKISLAKIEDLLVLKIVNRCLTTELYTFSDVEMVYSVNITLVYIIYSTTEYQRFI